MAGPTTIPALTGPQFAARIADLFPRGWCSDDAKQGGNVYALLLAAGNELSVVQQQVQYALSAQRLQSETFPELDFASIDFLGDAFPRPPGTTDAAFGQEIIAQLFLPAATRPALQDALTALTGSVPRMLEPWNINDTGAWGNVSYWGLTDTVANPARWGNGGLRYQGFIETAPPSVPALGNNNPVLCWGDSAYWNQPGYFFGIIGSSSLDLIDQVINRLRAYGTVVWVKIVTSVSLASITAPGPVTSLVASIAGPTSIALSWALPTVGSPPYSATVQYRQTNTTAWLTGPTVVANSATVTGLGAGVSYDFEVIIRNQSGAATSSTVTAQTTLTPPSPAQNLSATLVQANAVTLAWTAPTTGTPPFTFSVNYRVTGTTTWQNLIVGQSSLTVTVINLIPNTEYDFEIVTTNQ